MTTILDERPAHLKLFPDEVEPETDAVMPPPAPPKPKLAGPDSRDKEPCGTPGCGHPISLHSAGGCRGESIVKGGCPCSAYIPKSEC